LSVAPTLIMHAHGRVLLVWLSFYRTSVEPCSRTLWHHTHTCSDGVFNVLLKPSHIQPFLPSLSHNPFWPLFITLLFLVIGAMLFEKPTIPHKFHWGLGCTRILTQMGQFLPDRISGNDNKPCTTRRNRPHMKCTLVQSVDRTGRRNWPHTINHSWHADDIHLTPSGIM
jgi:hypothetical protein